MFFSKRRTNRQHHRRRFQLEVLEPRRVMASLPYGALPTDNAEFMLGSIVVTPVFFESNGTVDTNTEDWTPQLIQDTLAKIQEATDWWVQTLDNLNTVHHLNFTIDTTFAENPVSTPYEPINRKSNDYSKYVTDFLQGQGATTSDIETEMLKFNNAQREKFGTDWSYTMIVVNSYNDVDGTFAAGGSFSRAFSFAGGLFMVVPSSRPASTFAHETGHIFWARDEYAGGGSAGTYNGRRGYYNAQNTNAIDLNPDPNFVQQPTIMSSGTALDTAWTQHISSAATLAQIGWKDSDGDGIFDVLDVPLQLTGTGYLDTTTGKYRFLGNAKVQTLPNLNSSGNRSDITINKVRQIEYRFDGGAWQLYSQPGDYDVSLDLEITVPNNATKIEIRARDSESTVTSNVFDGSLVKADATEGPGINGFVWLDSNKNGLRDLGEYGQASWTVALVDGSGQQLQLKKVIEPNNLPDGPVGTSPINGAVLGAAGSSTDGRVGILVDPESVGGANKVFSAYSTSSQSFVTSWTTTGRQFQATFIADTTTVSIDAIGIGANSYGRLEAYNSSGQLLGRYTTSALTNGQVETMTINRGTSDISYIVAYGTARTSIKLDNLRYGPEASMLTDTKGHYYFPSLPAGQYQVRVTPSAGWAAETPASGQSQAVVVANTPTTDIDFAFVASTSAWQNPQQALDVNANDLISPVDALLIINQLNDGGGRMLQGSGIPTFPYLDVTGDGMLSPVDALLVINYLNDSKNGSGESASIELSSSDSVWGGFCSAAEYGGTPSVDGPEGEASKQGKSDDELLWLLSVDQLNLSAND